MLTEWKFGDILVRSDHANDKAVLFFIGPSPEYPTSFQAFAIVNGNAPVRGADIGKNWAWEHWKRKDD